MLDVRSIPAELRATRDATLARVEDAALTSSQPREQAFYDGWLLRYANGKAKRARSVNLTGSGSRPLAEKIAYCSEFYARRAMPLLFRMTPFSQPLGIDEAMGEAGFVAWEETRVMVLSLARVHPVEPPKVELTPVDASTFGATLASLHGLDAQRAGVERDRFARSAIDGTYLIARDGDDSIACGSAAIDGALVGIFGMVTADSFRSRGIATALLAALLDNARARDCTTAYLQVKADNEPARRAYRKFGFNDGYAYWYRSLPGAEEMM